MSAVAAHIATESDKLPVPLGLIFIFRNSNKFEYIKLPQSKDNQSVVLDAHVQIRSILCSVVIRYSANVCIVFGFSQSSQTSEMGK